MRTMPWVIPVSVTIMLLTATANATVLTTPAVLSNGETITCHVVNLSTKEQSVRVEIFDGFTGANTYDQVLPFGPAKVASVSSSGGGARMLYCRFTVSLPKAKLRGGIANEFTGASFPIQ